jgi:hypothetical protein
MNPPANSPNNIIPSNPSFGLSFTPAPCNFGLLVCVAAATGITAKLVYVLFAPFGKVVVIKSSLLTTPVGVIVVTIVLPWAFVVVMTIAPLEFSVGTGDVVTCPEESVANTAGTDVVTKTGEPIELVLERVMGTEVLADARTGTVVTWRLPAESVEETTRGIITGAFDKEVVGRAT